MLHTHILANRESLRNAFPHVLAISAKEALPVVREIEGLLRTLFDPRSTLTQQVSSELESHFGSKVYQTIVPRNVRLAEAPSYGKPVIAFDKGSRGAQAYSALAKEILERVGS